MRVLVSAVVVCVGAGVSVSAAPDASTRALIAAGHYKQARAILEPRVSVDSQDAEAAALLSRVKLAFGDLGAAEQLAELAVRLAPTVADYHWQLAQAVGELAQRANVLRQIGLARRFRQEAQATIALDPTHIDARFGLIVFYIKAPGIVGGDRKKADVMAEEIARIDPASGYLAKARALVESKTAGDVEALYRKAIDAAKSQDVKYDAISSLMNSYLSPKALRPDAAEEQARALLKIDAHRAAPYSGLAIAHAAAGRFADLDAVLADAAKAVPDDYEPLYQAGRILLLQGSELPRAERYFRNYLTQEPEGDAPGLPQAHWRLAQVLEKEGRRADAIAELEQALRLKPDLDSAKKDLRRLRAP